MARGTAAPVGALTKEVAAILRTRIARQQLLQKDIAESLHIGKTQLSDIINGKKHVDIELLDDICSAVGLDFMDVLKEAEKATQSRLL